MATKTARKLTPGDVVEYRSAFTTETATVKRVRDQLDPLGILVVDVVGGSGLNHGRSVQLRFRPGKRVTVVA